MEDFPFRLAYKQFTFPREMYKIRIGIERKKVIQFYVVRFVWEEKEEVCEGRGMC
jgi:hypothetical protein